MARKKDRKNLNVWDFQKSRNICDLLDAKEMENIGRNVVEGFNIDEESRIGWTERMENANKLALQIMEEKTFPWEGAANVKFPLITIAALQFSARAYPNLVKAPNLVKYRINGLDDNGEKAQRAERVGRHLSWQLLEQNESWEEDFDRQLIVLPISGCCFKKSFFDSTAEHNKSKLVLPKNLVMNYYARSVEECERKTEYFDLFPRQIKERQLDGIYRKVELTGKSHIPQDEAAKRQGITPPPDEPNKPRRILEQHTYLDLDGDGYVEPYVITVDEATKTVLRIASRFENVVTQQSKAIDSLNDQQKVLMAQMQSLAQKAQAAQQQLQQQQQQAQQEGKQLPPEAAAQVKDLTEQTQRQIQELTGKAEQLGQQIKALQESNESNPKVLRIEVFEHYTKYGFIPSPDGGVYDLGLGALLGPLNESVNTLINQLLDTGSLQSGSQGFIGKGARIKGGRIFFKPFEWQQVMVPGQTLKESIVPLPVNPPSDVLFRLLETLITYAEKVSSVNDMMTGENPGQNTPAYNYQVMVQQGMQVFNGIFKRVYRGLRSELRKLYKLNAIYLNPVEYFETQDGQFEVMLKDYKADPRDLYPAADPNAFSDVEKLAKAQFIAARASTVPGYRPEEVERRILEANDIGDVDRLFPLNEKGEMLLRPPPDPQIELDKVEAKRRERETEAKIQEIGATTTSKIELDRANVMLIAEKVKELGNDAMVKEFEAMTRRMEVERKRMEDLMQQESEERDRQSEERIARENARAAAARGSAGLA